MTQCEALLDRMPDVARGRAAWTPAESTHLGQCAECGAAWAAVRVAAELGVRQALVDPALVAAGVRGRLAAHRGDARVIRGWSAAAALAAAAALVLFVRSVPSSPATVESPVAVEAGPVFLPELDSLSTTELQSVLESVDRPVGALRTLDSQGMSDLSDDELAGVLQSLEG